MKNKISITINNKILRDVDSIIDNLFIRNRSQAIEYLLKESLKESKIAVILAGESKKMTPGKIRSRYSLKIDHFTIIEKEIHKLEYWGFKTIYIIADHKTLTSIFKIIGDGTSHNVKIEYIDEENPMGTAAALKLLKGKIKKTFLVVYCDTILDNLNILDFWNHHLREKTTATILASSTVTSDNDTLFGQLKLEGNKVISYIEKTASKKFDSSIFSRGIYIFEPEIFSYQGKDLESEIFPELAKRKVLGGIISSANHLHIHTHEDLVDVRKKLKLLT